jgi:hypothetical protein
MDSLPVDGCCLGDVLLYATVYLRIQFREWEDLDGAEVQQAHVERAAMRADEEYKILEEQHKASGSTSDLPRPPLSLFPRGAAASPDARYIVQCNDAARALLRICVENLFPGGALPYLPSRYLLWFTYAAIVLLKALYSGAMLRADHAE